MLAAPGITRVPPAPGAPVAEVTSAVSTLGHRMASLRPDGNWVASPLSAAVAFAMLRAGAAGSTASDLDAAFGFPPAGLHDAVNAVTAGQATVDVPQARSGDEPTPRPVVAIGNGLFVQDGLAIGPAFLETLARQYGTGVHPVDFGSADAAEVIGEWTRRRTAGRIRNAVDRTAPGVQFVLANTVYLRADWAAPFGVTPTTNAPFVTAAGQTPVPTMRAAGEFRHATGDGWQALELPYRGGDLAMRILLPESGHSPDDLLRPEAMARIAAELRPVPVDVHLPRWSFTADMDLAPLGPGVLYGPAADLSGIHPGLYLARAEQHAFIEVDERGTEAAAATALTGVISATVPPQRVFRADHPFAFAVVHTPTGLPLFVGRVTDPG